MGMNEKASLFHPRKLSTEHDGELLRLTRRRAHWEWMSFFVRRLLAGKTYQTHIKNEEAVFVLLGGICQADWGAGVCSLGKRLNVFRGFPYAVYLPPGNQISFTADTTCEIAECRVPSSARLEPKVIRPSDVTSTLRGGGNTSRQIVNVIPPSFSADRLMVYEVYTPGGNWSSYPPHKHDVHQPPAELDLDEIYYYRMRQPEGFAFQHLYSAENRTGSVVQARDGDTVLVRSGFHPVVAGPGYDIYYLNFLAGSARSLAVTEDPHHVWIRSTWDELDPRVPLVLG